MHKLTPLPLELHSYREDSADTRYFTLRLLQAQDMAPPKPGQFFMLTVPGHGEAPFTYATAPDHKGVFHALVRSVGELTRALFQLQSGARLGIRGPFGRGWPVKDLADQQVLIVAGGCGLAPLNGLIDKLLATEHCSQLALVYGARSAAHQVLNAQRQSWAEKIPVRDVLEDAPGGGTPLTVMPEVLKLFHSKGGLPDKVLLCGPEIMMQATAQYFLRRGLASEAIWASIERRMHCAVGLCGHCYLEHHYACTNGPSYPWSELQTLLRSTAPQTEINTTIAATRPS